MDFSMNHVSVTNKMSGSVLSHKILSSSNLSEFSEVALVYQHDKLLKFRFFDILVFIVFLDMLMRDLSGESKPRLTDFCKVEYNGEDLKMLTACDSNELFSPTHIDVSQS